MTWGLLCQGLATLVFGYAEWLCSLSRGCVSFLYVVARAFQGISSAWISGILFVLVAERFDEILGKLMKLNQIVNGIGMTLGPPIGATLREGTSISFPFVVIAGLTLLLIPFVHWDGPPLPKPGGIFSPAPNHGSIEHRTSAFPLVHHFGTLRAAGFLFLGTATFGLIEPVYALHAESYLRLTSVAIGYMLAIMFASYTGFGLLIGDDLAQGSSSCSNRRPHVVSALGGLLTACSLCGMGVRIESMTDDALAEKTQMLDKADGGTVVNNRTYRCIWEAFLLLCLGLGQALLLVPCLSAMKQSVDNTRLEQVLMLFNNVQQAALIVGPLIGALLAYMIGFQASVIAGGAICGLYSVLILMFSNDNIR